MRNEVTGDCAAKEGKQWFSIKSQQTGLCFCWDTLGAQKSSPSNGMGNESKQGERMLWNEVDKDVLGERDGFYKLLTPYPITLCNPSRLCLSIWHVDYIGQKEGNGRETRIGVR